MSSVPMYKKWERLKWSNHTLLNIAYKISAILLYKRLTNIDKKKLKECQMGFHPNRLLKIYLQLDNFFKSDMNIKEIFIIYSLTIHRVLTLYIGIK